MDNGESTALKTTMNSMNTRYQLVHPIKHREKNSERVNKTLNNHFIAVL